MNDFVIFRPSLSKEIPLTKWGVRHLGVGIVHNPNYSEFEAQWLANFHHHNPNATAQTALGELELYKTRITEPASKPPDESWKDYIGWGILPPARMVPASQDDLALAVRRMFTKVGKVDEAALLGFIIKVLGDQVPEQSPDPQPLIAGLEMIVRPNPNNPLDPVAVAMASLAKYWDKS